MSYDPSREVFVNRFTWGAKYLFANISIPAGWVSRDEISYPGELGREIGRWYEAYREKLAAEAAADVAARP